MTTIEYSSLEMLATCLLSANITFFFSCGQKCDILSPIMVVIGCKLSRSFQRDSSFICQKDDVISRSSLSAAVSRKCN